MDWDDYYSHDTITAFLDELETSYEDVEVVDLGQTFEKRTQKLIKITRAGPDSPNILLEGGEWKAIKAS